MDFDQVKFWMDECGCTTILETPQCYDDNDSLKSFLLNNGTWTILNAFSAVLTSFFLDQITLLIGLGKVLSSQVILTNSWCRKESRKRWFKGELWALYLHEKSSTNFTQIPKQLRHEKAIHSITLVKSFVQPCFSHFLQWV